MIKKTSEHFKYILIGIITGFTNGLFGSGGGSILVPITEKFLNMEEHKSHATAISIILPLSILSLLIYWYDGEVMWSLAIYASIGGVLGSFVGAKLLKKITGIWLHRIFGGFMLLASFRLFFY